MSGSDKSGMYILIVWISTILISIISGVLAWNWVEPESFLGAIGFIIIWGVLSTIGRIIAIGIAAIFER